ncbi:MAG TPA: hypothetical protein VE779_16360 [Candidatus Angelobacter sp.]|jgi:hypothetical protein|nr:hypothetical protein [Candidatus Angelobacter sp.]
MKRFTTSFTLLALALGLAMTAWAKPKSENITLYHDANINGTSLPAGDYVVKYDPDGKDTQVHFYKDNKEVASAAGELKTLPKKVQSNQVVLDTQNGSQTISEIDFGGKDTAISFASAGTAVGK